MRLTIDLYFDNSSELSQILDKIKAEINNGVERRQGYKFNYKILEGKKIEYTTENVKGVLCK